MIKGNVSCFCCSMLYVVGWLPRLITVTVTAYFFLKNLSIRNIIKIQTRHNPLLSDLVDLNSRLIITFHEVGKF